MKIKNNFYKVRETVLKKAKIKDGTAADNIKLGDMGSWAMLPGNHRWYIPELGLEIDGTCGEHCVGCCNIEDPRKSPCYVYKSIVKYTHRNEDGTVGDIIENKCSVKLGHAYRTLAMTLYRDDLLCSLDMQLRNKRKKFEVIRINESGELTCYEDFAMWCELARRHDETKFYIYTKNYEAIRVAIENDIIPSNMFVNISVWHLAGVKAYLDMQSHPQIRSFVLVDKEFTKEKYAQMGLFIDDMCSAYDENGKMNHAVTCERCGKCFNCRSKVTGCYEH